MYKHFIFFIFLSLVVFIESQLRDDQKCMITDSACITATAQQLVPYFTAGIEDLGIEQLDAMKTDQMIIDRYGLKLNITSICGEGLKKSVFESINFDMDDKILEICGHVSMNVTGQYKASGRLLMMSIDGDGDYAVQIENIHVCLKMPFKIMKNEDGKDVIALTNLTYSYDVLDKVHFDLPNFSPKVALVFLNMSWKLVINEFGDDLLDDHFQRIYEAIRKYFISHPLEDLVISY